MRFAAKRYLDKKTIATIKAAVKSLKRAAAVLTKHKTNMGGKRSALQTAEFFASRKARADFQAFDKIMRRRGGEKPRAGDELPPRSKSK